MAHLSRTTTTTTDPVACDGCANDTSGMCKSTADSTCTAATGVATDECGANFNLCTETSTVIADTLKFSIRLSGWNFASQSNKLQYTIDLKEPKGDKKDSDNISKKDGKTVLSSAQALDRNLNYGLMAMGVSISIIGVYVTLSK